jgi:hypothetical protein
MTKNGAIYLILDESKENLNSESSSRLKACLNRIKTLYLTIFYLKNRLVFDH